MSASIDLSCFGPDETIEVDAADGSSTYRLCGSRRHWEAILAELARKADERRAAGPPRHLQRLLMRQNDPHGHNTYQPCCSCGWADDDWYDEATAEAEWREHVADALCKFHGYDFGGDR